MIKTDFKLHLEDLEFLQYMGPNKVRKSIERILESPQKRADFDHAKADLLQLVDPKVGWRKLPLLGIEGERLILEDDIALGGGPVANIIQGAKEVIVGICTIGSRVEAAVAEHMKLNRLTRGYFLDLMANWAVDSVRNQFYSTLRTQVKEKDNFHTSIMMWPGQDWPLSDQVIIFDLLQDESKQINVTLTSSLLMIPQKTVTFLFGVGPDAIKMENGIQCQICSNKQTCPGYEVRIAWTQSTPL
ncbi:MAG: hypothetical protein ACW976_02300 [Candidatus Ranarchaeia archaeon]|jgi:hypothetical protein